MEWKGLDVMKMLLTLCMLFAVYLVTNSEVVQLDNSNFDQVRHVLLYACILPVILCSL